MSKSTPSSPDYNAAAQTQAQSSADVTEQQTVANRPNINTPFGAQSWQMKPTYDPVSGKLVSQWTQNTTLTPAMQQALTSQQGITQNKSNEAQSLLTQFDKQESSPQAPYTPFAATPGQTTDGSMGSAAGAYDKSAADASFNSWMGYNKPLMDQSRSQLDTQLQNQGLKPGDEAYDTAMANLDRTQGAQRQQATYGAVGLGDQVGQQQFASDLAAQQQRFGQNVTSANYQDTLRQSQIADDMQQKGFSLNQINAILNGQQVGLPSTPSFATAGSSQPVQALSAANSTGQAMLDQFNAQQQQTASTEAGIGSLALTALSFY